MKYHCTWVDGRCPRCGTRIEAAYHLTKNRCRPNRAPARGAKRRKNKTLPE